MIYEGEVPIMKGKYPQNTTKNKLAVNNYETLCDVRIPEHVCPDADELFGNRR